MNATPGADAAPSPEVVARCWGTRGSIPSPGPDTPKYGGNTPCLEVRAGDRTLIFDAGTGIRPLSRHLVGSPGPVEVDIFLTHFHWDHIQGFPFFAPLYDPDSVMRIHGPRQLDLDIRKLFARQMGPIYFPVPFEAVAASLDFRHLREESWEESGIRVSSMRMRHPAYTVGYRVDVGAHSICYIPDNELAGGSYPVVGDWEKRLLEFVRDASILFHDAMFLDSEYADRAGWGHSTFRQTVDLGREAGVERVYFFHHAPDRSDDALDAIVEELRLELAGSDDSIRLDAASEDSEITLKEI